MGEPFGSGHRIGVLGRTQARAITTQVTLGPEVADDIPLPIKPAVFAAVATMQAVVVTLFVVIGCYILFGGKMPIARTSKPRSAWLICAAVLIGVVIIPFLYVAKWIGYFTLNVELNLASDIDGSSITYAECWNADQAQSRYSDHSEYIAGFERPNNSTPNVHSVAITCMGEDRIFEFFDTYHHPLFLVVQYRTKDAAPDDYGRKLLAIPPGRGPRNTALTLP